MEIEKNEGNADRIVRIFIVIVLFTLAIFFSQGTARVFFIFFGVTLTITTVMGWCPLYLLFGFSTCDRKEKNE